MWRDPADGSAADRLTVYLARAGVAVLAFIAIVIIAFELFHPALRAHRLADAHELLETFFFISGIGIMAISMAALLIAKRHAHHAQLHAGYVDLQARISAEQAKIQCRSRQGRRLLEAIRNPDVRRHPERVQRDGGNADRIRRVRTNTGPTTISRYSDRQIRAWGDRGDTRVTVITRLFAVIEHIGLLVRRNYVSLDDVYFIFEGPLRHIGAICGDYLDNNREASVDRREYEHGIWLLRTVPSHRPRGRIIAGLRRAGQRLAICDAGRRDAGQPGVGYLPGVGGFTPALATGATAKTDNRP